MNKEAIERTKARCKKEIMDKDWTHVGLCFYVKKQKNAAAYDYMTGKEIDSYLQETHPPKAGEFVQMPNDWIPESKNEMSMLHVLIILETLMILFAVFVL